MVETPYESRRQLRDSLQVSKVTGTPAWHIRGYMATDNHCHLALLAADGHELL